MNSFDIDLSDKMADTKTSIALVKFSYLSNPNFPNELRSVNKGAAAAEGVFVKNLRLLKLPHKYSNIIENNIC